MKKNERNIKKIEGVSRRMKEIWKNKENEINMKENEDNIQEYEGCDE